MKIRALPSPRKDVASFQSCWYIKVDRTEEGDPELLVVVVVVVVPEKLLLFMFSIVVEDDVPAAAEAEAEDEGNTHKGIDPDPPERGGLAFLMTLLLEQQLLSSATSI